jgi:hypothetical protein
MIAPSDHPSANHARSRRFPWASCAAPLLFWPVFLVFTILEEKAGLAWLQTGNAALWRPIAILALLSGLVAPLILEGSVPGKIKASACSLLGFAALHGVVVVIGTALLNWGD